MTEADRLPLGNRPILFVGGKGGVGKTTLSAALALQLAEAGERVLLVSTDPAHSLGDLLDRAIGDQETPIFTAPSGGMVVALEVDAEAETDRYLEGVRDAMRSFVRPALFGEVERQIELTRQSPGAAEAALLDRVAALMEEGPERFDRILFDTAPTGHTLRLLALPELMTAWTEGLLRRREAADALGSAMDRLRGGRGEGTLRDPAEAESSDPRLQRLRARLLERRRRFSTARRLLLDPRQVGFLFVLNPEKLPILETATALRVLDTHGVPVLGILVNRVLPAGPLGDFLEARRAQEERYLERIDEEFGHLPRVRIPLEAGDVVGIRGLQALARTLPTEAGG